KTKFYSRLIICGSIILNNLLDARFLTLDPGCWSSGMKKCHPREGRDDVNRLGCQYFRHDTKFKF
ncbi:MAG: hypothetical protein KC618_05670, partial [Candidatus Omnitrophica bacterium]|nr:hypothetical protein [Candidatus Omnitrophota bacterium]